MKNINDLRNYLTESEFKITILKNKINLINYESIEHFDANKIMIKSDSGLIVINGKNLVVTRLLIDEVLITGIIHNIEFR